MTSGSQVGSGSRGGPLDRVVRPPEHVVVLRLPAGDHRVGDRDPGRAEELCRLRDVEAALATESPQAAAELDVGRVGEEPDRLGLLGRARGRRVAPQQLHLGHVVRVLLARDGVRRGRPVGRRVVGERPHLPELHVNRRGRSDGLEDSRADRCLDVGHDIVEPVAGPQGEHPRRSGSADRLATVSRKPRRQRRHVGVVCRLDARRLGRNAGDQDVAGRLRDRGFDQGVRRCGDAGRERLQVAFDRGDRVVDRPVHHSREHGAARRWTERGRRGRRRRDRSLGDPAPVHDGVVAGGRRRRRRAEPQRGESCHHRRQDHPCLHQFDLLVWLARRGSLRKESRESWKPQLFDSTRPSSPRERIPSLR